MSLLNGVELRHVWSGQANFLNEQRRPVRIAGYLSRAGEYGHLGMSEHEVLVTAVVPVDAGSR